MNKEYIENRFNLLTNNYNNLRLLEITDELLCFGNNSVDISKDEFKIIFDLLEAINIKKYSIETRCVSNQVSLIYVEF